VLITPAIQEPASSSVKPKISTHVPLEEFRKFREAMRHPTAQLVASDVAQPDDTRNEVIALCDEVLTSISDFMTAMEELSIWKNEFVSES